MQIKQIGTLEDIDKRSDLTLITDGKEVYDILFSINGPEAIRLQEENSLYALFVKVEDGEYKEVYGFKGNIPFLWKRLYQIFF